MKTDNETKIVQLKEKENESLAILENFKRDIKVPT